MEPRIKTPQFLAQDLAAAHDAAVEHTRTLTRVAHACEGGVTALAALHAHVGTPSERGVQAAASRRIADEQPSSYSSLRPSSARGL